MIKSRGATHVECAEELKYTYTIFTEKPHRRRENGRPMYKWKDAIKTDF